MSFDAGARLSHGRSALPGGTVTFAFTDIEGSTGLMRRLGERYGGVLSEHRRIVRTSFGEANGIEIDRQGDAFFFAFQRARDAVGAAVRVQRDHAETAWPDGADVRVRIGLHTGEPAVGDEGYLGIDVVRAARICTVARGGHVLVSETTRALVRSTLPDGVSVAPAGERQLKDFDEPERIYELVVDGLDGSAPGESHSLERRLGHAGLRLAGRVGHRVAGDANLEDLAGRAASTLEGTIRSGVSAALRTAAGHVR